ncbi:glycosyltransferase family 4 protein [Segetibacter koreensis]|uniref:glycosyltransferase family 4 protein n=1 Tax=Segetibacter koreensis TaxID=398037 RepID=UPI0003619EB3|nr:glycosyltransferase family 4 protein [Segetibacter koreensis]
MKVAILAPVTWRTPPRNYGPWEQVASVLAEGLVEQGVDVTLFATGDSVTRGKLASVREKPLGEFPGDAKVVECLHISNVMEQATSFDIIHNHFDFLPLTYSALVRTPMITTIHGFSSEQIIPVYRKYNANTHYVSISNSDRHPDLTYLDTVYNGLNDQQFQLGLGKGNYLLYFGRIHPDKGAYEAIQIAAKSNKKLVLCGLIQDQEYFDKQVAPYLNDTSIIYLGNAGPEQRNQLLGDAIALLHPISFEEPFGLSVAEAMMCGTPVIAFSRGAMKELIIDGKTGFLVNNIAEAIVAVGKIISICRNECRNHAMKKFSSKVMVFGYIRLYQQILRKSNSI